MQSRIQSQMAAVQNELHIHYNNGEHYWTLYGGNKHE